MGLGSNLGDWDRNLAMAREGLQTLDGVEELQGSRVYLTEPQGLKEQPWFANQVVKLRLGEHGPGPLELMRELAAMEARMGRDRSAEPRDGPRIIDLDLLLYGTIVYQSEELILPHPRMLRRAFVLVPLLDLAPPCADGFLQALKRLDYSIKDGVIRQP